MNEWKDHPEAKHIISLGAGVQSSTMALMAAHGEIEPMPECAIFADTQDEPAAVYEWLDYLKGQLPFPVHVVTKGRLSLAALSLHTSKKTGKQYTKGKLPFFTKSKSGDQGMIRHRACTADFKILPILKKAKEIGDVPRGCRDVRIVQWIGISLDEVSRMKPSRNAWSVSRWPLIEKPMTRHDCKKWMQDNGYPEPPRSACVYCPFHSNDEWRRLKENAPDDFKIAVKFEQDANAIRDLSSADVMLKDTLYLHRSCAPLDQVDFSTEEDRGQLDMFNNDCSGMCGV